MTLSSSARSTPSASLTHLAAPRHGLSYAVVFRIRERALMPPTPLARPFSTDDPDGYRCLLRAPGSASVLRDLLIQFLHPCFQTRHHIGVVDREVGLFAKVITQIE